MDNPVLSRQLLRRKLLLLLAATLLVAANWTTFRNRYCDLVLTRYLRQLHTEVAGVTPAKPVFYSDRAKAPDHLQPPYDVYNIPAGIDVFLMRKKYGYSGYSFDLLVDAGWHEHSTVEVVQIELRVNGKTYEYRLERPRAREGSHERA